MQDVHQAVVRTGNRLEFKQALEFALEMLDVLKSLLVDDFHRAHRADGVKGQPDFTVTASPDQTEQLVIGDLGSWRLIR